jgi:long-chain fatty acid transport protein
MGAKARGMGGVSIGMSHGAESGLANPALITTVKGTEISFGGTIFMPDVETTIPNPGGINSVKSDADLSVIPEVAIAQNIGNGLSWGIGMFGTAGMGTDYRGTGQNMEMVTNLQLMQFAVPVAYKVGAFSIGIAPVLQYGSLDINYVSPAGALDGTNPETKSSTSGVAQDFGIGYNIGVAYSEEGLTLGASYKSAIDMEYKGQIGAAMEDFTGVYGSDNLEQPAEIGVGASYTFGGNTIAIDYKKIQWSNAKGYKDFKWEDQDVYMIGYQFAQDSWAVRAGYNYAKSPITNQPVVASNMYQGSLINTLNLLGFPAIVEQHYTIGGSYALSKATSIDLAYVYVPEATEKFDTMTPNNTSYIETKHSQDAVSMQVNFAF